MQRLRVRCALVSAFLLSLTFAYQSNAASMVSLSGQPSDVGFGVSVAIPGDLNGDGLDDVTVGATTFDGEGNAVPGRVLVYFGGGDFSAPDLVLTGEANGDRFGYEHRPAGDVDGDGYLDLLVGAYQNDANGSNSGRAYIYRGGPGMDSTPDLVITGVQSGEQAGIAVAGIGDVNVDGYDDVLIGARFNTAGGSEAGRAYVIYGGPAMDSVADLVLNSQSSIERLGFAVTGGQDVNGDGYADFMVGAYHNPALGFETGRVYVYFGGPAVDANADLVLDGEGFRAHFGDALGVADANGDGEADILVGASQYSNATGRAYVYFGGSGLDANPDLILQPGALGDWVGRFVSGGGDFNQDGFADLLIGAPALNSGGPGRVYLYHGGMFLDASSDGVLTGEVPGDAFGWNGWAGPQDVDGDGLHDFIVGGFRNDAGGPGSGRAYLFLSGSGNRPPDCSKATATLALLWPPNRQFVGVGITGVTDPDGDSTTVRVDAIHSDEPTRVRRGDPCPDALIDGPTARLRAESHPAGNGRVYTLSFEATDHEGARCRGNVTVCVPVAVNATCVDDGPGGNATLCTSLASSGVVIRGGLSQVRITFDLEAAQSVGARLYDVRGRLVRNLAGAAYPPGLHDLVWDGRDGAGRLMPAGIYVLRLTTNGSDETVKFALMR